MESLDENHPESIYGNILVVDDTPENLQVLMDILSTRGHEVRLASDGQIALLSIQSTPPDLILLDVRMPEMDGYEICRRLKADERFCTIPIIFLSALDDPEDKIKAFDVGGIDYITKPFHPEEVVARVKTHMLLRKMQGRLREQNLRLQQEICERAQAETALERAYSKVEEQVKTRTERLQEENQARRQAEQEVRVLNEQLELRVRQRTAELETANKELREFTYVASHDLKAPLRSISRLVSWLLHDYLPQVDTEGQKMIDLLLGSVHRMDHLLDGILEYSRISRKLNPPLPLELQPLAQEIFESLDPPDSLRFHIDGLLPLVVYNKAHLAQVLRHLFGNAISHLDHDRGEIEIACRDDGEYWICSISDNGPGIDMKYHGKIFQIFQSLKPPHNDGSNTGVGLAIVKKIVELHGGKVWLESALGEGSCFYFSIPKSPPPVERKTEKDI